MLLARKKLKTKAEEMADMNMRGVMIVESMCREYARLDYICRSLKKRNEINETWFFNGRLHIKLAPTSRRIQDSHNEELYEHFGRTIIDDIISSSRRSSPGG